MTGRAPLTGTFFQLGYVTRDIDAAIALYAERYGVTSFKRYSSNTPVPGKPDISIEVALAYQGDLMIEFIRPDPVSPGIYKDAVRDDGGLTLHHLGYLVEPDRFATLGDDFRALGTPVPTERTAMGVSFLYADTRAETALFSEFVMASDTVRTFFASIPRH